MSDRTLFPRQASAKDRLRESLRSGKRRPILCSPTGFGKGDLMAYITRSYQDRDRGSLI